MVWTLYVLSKNLHWQQRLREEVIEAHGSDTERSLDFYDRLPFLNALIKVHPIPMPSHLLRHNTEHKVFQEVMRVYSPFPSTERIATRDTVIPVSQPITTRNGKQITEIPVKKGQCVGIAITSYNR